MSSWANPPLELLTQELVSRHQGELVGFVQDTGRQTAEHPN